MTKTASFFLAAAMTFSLAACDTEGEPSDPATRSAEADTEAADAPQGVQAGHHGKHNPGQMICAELDCSDEQLSQISALIEARHADRPDEATREAKRAEHKTMKDEVHAKLAAAFRAEEFDASILATIHPPRDKGDHEDQMIAFAVELHGILTPEQRTKLADGIAERGPMFFHGPRGHKKGHGKKGMHHGEGMKGMHHGEGMKHHGEDNKHHGEWTEEKVAAKIAGHVDELCETVTCSDDQRTRLTATFQGVREEHHDAKKSAEKPNFSPLADVFRAETIDEAQLRTALEGTKAEHGERMKGHGESMGTVMAEVHDILTPEQRGLVADKIEAGEMGMMMGRHHKKGHGDSPCEGDCDKPCDGEGAKAHHGKKGDEPCGDDCDKPCDHG